MKSLTITRKPLDGSSRKLEVLYAALEINCVSLVTENKEKCS